MPDIPIDTLFIIGLVIASFVGKFFQKKNEDASSSKSKPAKSSSTDGKNPTLRDVLKEAWERANQPEVLQPEFTDTTPPPLPIEEVESETEDEKLLSNEDILPQAVAIKKEQGFPTDTSRNSRQGTHSWIKRDLFSSRNSLRQAFVLKEILDKPKSLRSFS